MPGPEQAEGHSTGAASKPRKDPHRLRLLGLERETEDVRARPSCVILQIDGLSYEDFSAALDAGKLPFLASYLKRGRGIAGPWRAMLPTSTSAFQAGLFYGDNSDVPGFFWYDKGRGAEVRMDGLADTARMEERLRERAAPFEGLLHKGAAYSTIFSGGAQNTLLTFSRLFHPRLNLDTKPTRLAVFVFSQVLLLLRLAYYTLTEIVIAFYDLLAGLVSQRNKFLEFKFLFPRIVSVVLCREIATLAAILDIHRGVGPIYANYFAYDEHAHHRGPSSKFAHWTLKGIDGAIRRIAKAIEKAERDGVRQYDLYVWSDHGQVPAVPFHELFEQAPERHFDLLFQALYGGTEAQREEASALRESERIRRGRVVRGQVQRYAPQRVERQARRAEDMQGFVPGPLRRFYRRLVGLARGGESPAGATDTTEDLQGAQEPAQHRVLLVSTGPVAHLYYTGDAEPLCYEAWEERFPVFLEQIASHGGVGFALARSRDGGARLGTAGQWFDIHDEQALEAHAPALIANVVRARREELVRWANMPSAGDLVLVGERSEDAPVVSYTYERGGHAGVSERETTPFFVAPARSKELWPELTAASEDPLTLHDIHERLRDTYAT